LDQFFATRRRLKVGLVIAGAVSGALGGAALTVLGKIVTDAPPATPQTYLWNMAFFGVIGAYVSPVITWSSLRRVVEPLVAGVAGATVGVLFGSGVALLVLAPLGVAAAIARLSYAYRDDQAAARLNDGKDK
jgi:hypothetical protein